MGQTEAAAGTHALVTGTKFMTFAVAGGDGATTEAATVTIDGATTGAATSNYALLVTGNGDTSKFAGDVLVGADVTINGGDIDMSGSTSNTFKLAASQAAALTFKHGSTSVMKLDTRGTASDSKTSGSVIVTGGVGVSGQVSADTMEVFATTASSSKTTGSLKVAGGVGVSGAVFADTVIVKAAAATLAQDASFSSLTVNPGAQTEAAAGTHALVTGTKFMTFAVAGGDGATTEAATVTID